MQVPRPEDTEIIDVGKPTTIIITRAVVEFSTMPTVVQWFNAEHAICGATSLGTVQQQTHHNYYADGVVLEIMTMPIARNQDYI